MKYEEELNTHAIQTLNEARREFAKQLLKPSNLLSILPDDITNKIKAECKTFLERCKFAMVDFKLPDNWQHTVLTFTLNPSEMKLHQTTIRIGDSADDQDEYAILIGQFAGFTLGLKNNELKHTHTRNLVDFKWNNLVMTFTPKHIHVSLKS